MEEKGRDSRRRRIVQGGSDRLAFITGQISSLPAAPPPTPTVPLTTEAIPPPHLPRSATPMDTSPIPSVPLVHEERQPRYEDQEITAEHDNSEAVRGSTSLNSKVKQENDSSSFVSNDKPQSLFPPLPRPWVHSSIVHNPMKVTSKQIISAISATENIRAICAIIMALLVIISHDGASLIATIIRWLVPFPVYMILLTDVTTVLAHAMANKSRMGSDEWRGNMGSDEHDWTDQLEKTLGVGWVVYKAMSAIFMDCSIYAVLMVSGLSFV